MGVRATVEVSFIYKPQEVPIPLVKDEILRLDCLLLRYSNRKKTYLGRIWLAWTLVSMWYTDVFGVCQVLPIIHPDIE